MSLFNNKLQKVQLGMLADDVQQKFTDTATQLADNAKQSALDIEKRRIDNLIAVQSSTDNAETADIRVGADGATYGSAGEAVRLQVNQLKGDLDNVLVTEKGKQLFDLSTVVHGKFFDNDNANYSTSDFIKVNPGHRVYVYRYDNHSEVNVIAWGIARYDGSKNLLGYVQLATIANYYDNEDAAYIKIGCDSSYISLIAVEEDGMTISSLTPYTPPIYKLNTILKVSDNTTNVLYGKKMITLGDSITYGAGVDDISKNWGSLIAKRNNMTYLNAGISGSTMGEAVDGSNTNASYKNGRHLAIQGYDYATIWFGWNDYNFCSLGTYDGTDTKKTLVAYRKTLEYVIENFIETKIGVIIPYLWCYNTDPQDHTIMQMINGIKAVCDLCGIPYLDINKYNFLPSWGSDYPNNDQYYIKWDQRQQVFTSDTLHPNEKGNQYLSTIIENFLRSL